MSFDTLAYSQKLRSSGIPSEHAEAHAEALKAALAETVATKSDVEAVRRDLKDVEAALKLEIERVRREMAEAKTDIIKWLAGIGIALFIALLGILAKLLWP
jgi:hypothetical protein